MYDQHTADLVRENERMRAMLAAIKRYAEAAVFGAWRQTVIDMAREGLAKPKQNQDR